MKWVKIYIEKQTKSLLDRYGPRGENYTFVVMMLLKHYWECFELINNRKLKSLKLHNNTKHRFARLKAKSLSDDRFLNRILDHCETCKVPFWDEMK